MSATLFAISSAEPSAVRAELDSMRSVAEALEDLPDNEARARVLQWAAEFFDVTDAVASQALAPPANIPRSQAQFHKDPSLAVADLSSFFEDEPVLEEPVVDGQVVDNANGGVASMLHRFVLDFQNLARDWQGDNRTG